MWSADGARVYFMSDQGGAENIWEKAVHGGAPRQVTQFNDGRVLWPSISYDGKTIVFERDFGIWKLDTATGKAAPIEITRRGATGTPEVTHLSLNNQFRDLVLAPDGRKLAFTAHGEVFAARRRDGGAAAASPAPRRNENQIAWSPDSRRMVYVSDRDGTYHLYCYDFSTNAEDAPHQRRRRRNRARMERRRQTAGLRARRQTVVRLRCGREAGARPGQRTFSEPALRLQPLLHLVARQPVDCLLRPPATAAFRNVFVVPAAGGEPRQISFLANTNGGTLLWAPDGTYILFDTNQRTENNNIARIDLVLKTPRFREDRFRDLFRDTPPPRPDARPRRGRTHGRPSPSRSSSKTSAAA